MTISRRTGVEGENWGADLWREESPWQALPVQKATQGRALQVPRRNVNRSAHCRRKASVNSSHARRLEALAAAPESKPMMRAGARDLQISNLAAN